MTIIISLDACEAVPPICVAKILQGGTIPKGGGIWTITNEIKPSDLYCYLNAKFGPPNGLQNFLRKDDSDNLIHWDWTLVHNNGLIVILGLNMRTEIHIIGKDWDFPNCDKAQFIDYIKRDFANYGKQMSTFRIQTLEDWDLIVNPYKLLKDAIAQLKEDLDSLNLNVIEERINNPPFSSDFELFTKKWTEVTSKYHRGVGLAMALRAMTPVLAESFVNLLLFILCRPDIKKNDRLYASVVRANIDIRVQSLHINCVGFEKDIDWKSPECGKYSSIVNERNDMLHGNVIVEKLKFSEIHFLGKVPIFKKYEDYWQQSIGVSINASGLEKVSSDLSAVEDFINYILSCLNQGLKEEVDILINRRDLGVNKKTGRLGALLPNEIADFGVPLIKI